jgi:diphosphomevalonate decarboxylase
MNETLDAKYRGEAAELGGLFGIRSGHATWECPSNIALVKYWGKKGFQLPLNPSLSITLNSAITRLSVDFEKVEGKREVTLDYLFENMPNSSFHERLVKYLQVISRYMPFLKTLHLSIQSHNTFPHSSGIASSASAFGALALSLCSIEQICFNTPETGKEFLRKASFLARLGSGSASRSVYGGYSLWGKAEEIPLSSDEEAIPINSEIADVFRDYCDSILIIQTGKKEISSSTGHALMENHPFASARIIQANRNLMDLMRSLRAGDVIRYIEIIENEALTLQALMLSSLPGYFLFHANTLEVIKRVREFRRETDIGIGFTLDAGANIHLLYPSRVANEVRAFIDTALLPCCENGIVFHDFAGNGPERIE